MPLVYEKKQVPENCSTRLYLSDNPFRICGRCGVTQEQAFRYSLFGGCPYYWLNQHKYTRAD